MNLTKILERLTELEEYLKQEGVAVWDCSDDYQAAINYYYELQGQAIALVSPVCIGKTLEDIQPCSEPLKSILKSAIHQLSRGFIQPIHSSELSLDSEELRLVKDSLK